MEEDTHLTRILVVELWNIGDVILAMPFLAQLRSTFPDAETTLLARPHAAEVLAGSGLVDQFIEADLTWKRERHHNPFDYNWHELGRVVAALRKKKFDLAFQCRPHVREHVLLALSGARRRIGWQQGIWSRALTDPIAIPGSGVQKKEAWLRLLEPFGGAKAIDPPRLHLSAAEQDWAEDFLAANGVGSTTRLVGIHPGASIPQKRWPLSGFRDVAAHLVGRSGIKVLAFAEPEGYGSSLNDIRGVIPVREGLRRMIALLQRCELLICNDSGPMHIAAALGVPTVAVFGSGIDRSFAPPGDQNEAVVADRSSHSLPEAGSEPGPYDDVSRVSVAQVLEAAGRALDNTRTTGEAAKQARLLLNHGRR